MTGVQTCALPIFGHMKQECPTYLKTTGKSKALVATLSDIEPEDDLDNDD